MKTPDTEEKKLIQRKIIKSLADLPAYPDVILKAKRIIHNKQSGIGDISDVIVKDPALAARVLKLANSAYYSITKTTGSIKYAAQILGVQTLCEIIETAAAAPLLKTQLKGYEISSEQFFKHSLFTAYTAKTMCGYFYHGFESDAFTAGLLHDCGKLALSPWIDRYSKIYNSLINQANENIDAEISLTGIHHGHTGYAMVKLWNLPVHIQKAIKDHHRKKFNKDEKFTLIISMADHLAKDYIEKGFIDHEIFNKLTAGFDEIVIDIDKFIEISSQASDFTEQIISQLK
ncbi:MAG: HDOD domain-containing protein [Thermodesulfobacteriota bacterium]